MNVLQRPREKEFCATMRDYIIDTDVTITFAVKYGGKTILDEEYVPDANNQVRVRKLGKFCELALWGVWCAGETSWQTDAAGTFTFLINGVQDGQSFVMFSRMQTKKDADAPGWLSEVNRKVTRDGCKEYVSMVMGRGAQVTVTGYASDGSNVDALLLRIDSGDTVAPMTLDVSPERIKGLFPDLNLERYVVNCNNNGYEFLIDKTRYLDIWCFRYKNVYDMPETLSAVGGISINGKNEDDTASMFGVDRKFAVKVADEYTANSGIIMLQSDYKLWHNLMNAQEADILVDGEWLPILITKQKYERELRRSVLKAVEFTFRMADPEQNNLIQV